MNLGAIYYKKYGVYHMYPATMTYPNFNSYC